ncbi:MAG TPA: Zn-ribbon domain-containing OB-fold protein [Burkholderiales bacterium]|nr:Zn-ribbon domain-containing OB-fold protein [Burkholderiales bacterium]
MTQLPAPAFNADSKRFWEAARENRLLVSHCDACTRLFFPPRHLCPHCWSDKISWRDSGGAGVVYSFTIIHRAPVAEFAPRVPYVVALITLAEGPRMMANIVGEDALETRVGDAVKVEFEPRADGWKVPQFRRSAR